MNRERLSVFASFTPAMCMGLLMGFEYLSQEKMISGNIYTAMGAEAVAFIAPFAILMLLMQFTSERGTLRIKAKVKGSTAFVIYISIATAIGAFLLNCLVGMLKGGTIVQSPVYSSMWQQGESISWTIVLALAVVPAVCEELFFRSGFFSIYESNGTYAAIIASALTFALVHGTADNFVGPLAAGLVFGYITYALGSVWPAVFAHLLNNLWYICINYFLRTYGAFGIWTYFIIFSIVMFCIFLHLAMRKLEKLIEDGKIVRFKGASIGKIAAVTLLSPGIWMLILMFCFRVFYG